MKYCYYVCVNRFDKISRESVKTKFAIPAGSVDEAKTVATQYGEVISIDDRKDLLGKGWQ